MLYGSYILQVYVKSYLEVRARAEAAKVAKASKSTAEEHMSVSNGPSFSANTMAWDDDDDDDEDDEDFDPDESDDDNSSGDDSGSDDSVAIRQAINDKDDDDDDDDSYKGDSGKGKKALKSSKASKSASESTKASKKSIKDKDRAIVVGSQKCSVKQEQSRKVGVDISNTASSSNSSGISGIKRVKQESEQGIIKIPVDTENKVCVKRLKCADDDEVIFVESPNKMATKEVVEVM